jgi:hypothetical protein
MELVQSQADFSLDVAKLISFIHAQNYYCTFGEAFRTPEQAAIYAQEGKGISKSLHTKRLAIDLNIYDAKANLLTDSADYEKFGIFWESLNKTNRWGGYFVSKYGGHIVDGDHFERNVT